VIPCWPRSIARSLDWTGREDKALSGAQERTEIGVPITHQPSWLSWVGSVTACRRVLGVECDQTDVAGCSGYAFALSINAGVCPSGPTSLDWGALGAGPMSLGRSVGVFQSGDCHTDGSRSDRSREHCRHVIEIVRHEIEAGRPCVVWGLGCPEFGCVRGFDAEAYLCVAGGPTPERVAFDEIDAPGGPAVFWFPTEADPGGGDDLGALVRAIDMMTRSNAGAGRLRGLDAYDFWGEELRARRALVLGNSYNAQCWAEARRHACAFLDRIVGRYPCAHRIGLARDAFADVAAALRSVAEIFPFSSEPGVVEGEARIDEAVRHLALAREHEARAIDLLREAIATLVSMGGERFGRGSS
jgi:hypothetical protein